LLSKMILLRRVFHLMCVFLRLFDSFFKCFLLLYSSCTGGFIVTFLYVYTMYPGLVHPLCCLPSSSSPF
jgi:hypothetical protein